MKGYSCLLLRLLCRYYSNSKALQSDFEVRYTYDKRLQAQNTTKRKSEVREEKKKKRKNEDEKRREENKKRAKEVKDITPMLTRAAGRT